MYVCTCAHHVGTSWLKYLTWEGNVVLPNRGGKEKEMWEYMTFRCEICIWQILHSAEDLYGYPQRPANDSHSWLNVGLQGVNFARSYTPVFFLYFPFSFFLKKKQLNLPFFFPIWTNAGHRFLVKVTTLPFLRQRIGNPRWGAMTIFMTMACALKGPLHGCWFQYLCR